MSMYRWQGTQPPTGTAPPYRPPASARHIHGTPRHRRRGRSDACRKRLRAFWKAIAHGRHNGGVMPQAIITAPLRGLSMSCVARQAGIPLAVRPRDDRGERLARIAEPPALPAQRIAHIVRLAGRHLNKAHRFRRAPLADSPPGVERTLDVARGGHRRWQLKASSLSRRRGDTMTRTSPQAGARHPPHHARSQTAETTSRARRST